MSQLPASSDDSGVPSISVLGEVLFDHLPEGKKILGGAPFNVAWNLKGLGLDPIFVSAIGHDDEGCEVLNSMSEWGLRTEAVVRIPNRSTGRVDVTITDSEPDYEIPLDQSFDCLEFDYFPSNLSDLLSSAKLLYHGSLVFRTSANRKFFQKLSQVRNIPRFVDLNIRQPWFDPGWVHELVNDAAWVKLNIDELNYLSDSDADPTQIASVQSAVEKLRTQEKLTTAQTFLITCGAHGAYWMAGSDSYFAPASSIPSFADSVGAGDAFSAAAITGIIRSQPPEAILKNAVRFAASACEINGATSNDFDHYANFSVTKADTQA